MAKTHHTSLSKRLTPLYVAAFLQGLIFWYAIEKVFMTSIGFNSKTIAITTIIFTAITLLANVPIGILADRWSRKGILMLASCAMALSCAIGGSSHGVWTYLIAACLSGLFYACYQGVYDSVVYDVLVEETGSADKFDHYYGRVQLYDGIALVTGALLSSVITHFLDFRAAYFVTIPFALCALVALYYFKEPSEHKKEVSQLLGAHIKSTFKAILKKGEVFWIVATLVLISVVMKMLLDFDQLWFIAVALPIVLYGPFDALLLTSFSGGGFLAGKLRSDKLAVACGLIALLSSFALLTHHSYLIILAQTIIVTILVVYSIVFERYLHDNLSSKIRVGAASVVATIGGIVFLPVAYLFGEISHRYSIFSAAWVIIVILVAVILSGVKVVASKRLANIKMHPGLQYKL